MRKKFIDRIMSLLAKLHPESLKPKFPKLTDGHNDASFLIFSLQNSPFIDDLFSLTNIVRDLGAKLFPQTFLRL